jgi:hypothetical protein
MSQCLIGLYVGGNVFAASIGPNGVVIDGGASVSSVRISTDHSPTAPPHPSSK